MKKKKLKKLNQMQGVYQHYKGPLYEVVGVGRHSETEEEIVSYYDESGNLWFRPLKMFNESIVIDGEKKKRFTLLKNFELPRPDTIGWYRILKKYESYYPKILMKE